jgi:hypothetical protein
MPTLNLTAAPAAAAVTSLSARSLHSVPLPALPLLAVSALLLPQPLEQQQQPAARHSEPPAAVLHLEDLAQQRQARLRLARRLQQQRRRLAPLLLRLRLVLRLLRGALEHRPQHSSRWEI